MSENEITHSRINPISLCPNSQLGHTNMIQKRKGELSDVEFGKRLKQSGSDILQDLSLPGKPELELGASQMNDHNQVSSSAENHSVDCDSSSVTEVNELNESANSELLRLSDYVLLAIMAYLPPYDLLNLSHTCTRLESLCKDRSLWTELDLRRYYLKFCQIWAFVPFLQPTTKLIAVQGSECFKALPNCWKIYHKVLTEISNKCKNLDTFIINKYVFDSRKVKLSDFPHTLKKLSITSCHMGYLDHRGESYFHNMHELMPRLEILDLSYCSWLSGHSLMAISKCPTLRELYLRGCWRLAGCSAYINLAARFGFRALEVLDVRETFLCDSDIGGFNHIRTLTHLYLEFAEKHNDSWFGGRPIESAPRKDEDSMEGCKCAALQHPHVLDPKLSLGESSCAQNNSSSGKKQRNTSEYMDKPFLHMQNVYISFRTFQDFVNPSSQEQVDRSEEAEKHGATVNADNNGSLENVETNEGNVQLVIQVEENELKNQEENEETDEEEEEEDEEEDQIMRRRVVRFMDPLLDDIHNPSHVTDLGIGMLGTESNNIQMFSRPRPQFVRLVGLHGPTESNPNLQHLTARGYLAITDNSLQHFARVSSLRYLDITGTAVTLSGVQRFIAIRPDVQLVSTFDNES